MNAVTFDDAEIPRRASAGQPVALSYGQEQLWLLQQLDPAQTAYNLPRVFRLRGALNADALERAFRAVVQRHAVLRTCFTSTGGVPSQTIQASADFSLERVEVTTAAETELIVRRVATHVFDLAHAPALRAALVRVATDEHVLVICLHHIVSDAWSNPILAADLSAAYRQALRGAAVDLPPLTLHYADFAAWQRDHLKGEVLDDLLAHWNHHLGPQVPSLSLPTDHPRAARPDFRGSALHFQLDRGLADALRAFCRTERCTPFVVLLAAWQMLLARWSGQRDFAVGVPNAGRLRDELQDLLGFFVTTQVYRVRLSPADTLRSICRRVRSDALAALGAADLPLELLLSRRQDRREPGRSPLFQVMFGVQMAGDDAGLTLEGVDTAFVEFDEAGAKFELSLDMDVGPEAVNGRLEFNTGLFERRTAEWLAAAYQRVLVQMLQAPDRLFADLSLLDEAEHAPLRAWSEGDPAADAFEPVHRLFEAQVQQRPDATALVFGDAAWSYAELNRRANQLAHRLMAHGVGPDSIVGVFAERSLEMVLSLLAVLKAGGAYLPLDPDQPADRVRAMVEDGGARLVFEPARHRGAWPAVADVDVWWLDELVVEDSRSRDPRIALHGEHLAYLIFTSGSTGRPKGAANRHAALHNRLAWMQRAYPLGPDDTVLQKTPFGFDVSVWEFFWPLMVGARLAIAAPGDHRDPMRLAALIDTHRVTTLHFVPSMLQAFLAHPGAYACTRLRQVVCSGEALPASAQQEVFRRWPQVAVHNLYGPTEAAIDVTHWTCRDDGTGPVPIGQPIDAVRTYVLDEFLSPAPQGVPGELYLGGIGLARGYLGKPGLSAERFVADPMSDRGERLYRTGDLVRWRADGQLDYLGRLDHQVKVRGVRIELGEIEAALSGLPGVREAVVVAQPSAQGQRLVAYVTPSSEPLQPATLRERLAAGLPEAMVPAVVMVLDRLPLNANGKVDRRALPLPQPGTTSPSAGPLRESERALAALWADLLGLPSVGRDDNFFDIGGHSLLMARLQARLQEDMGLAVPMVELFQHPTVATLAQHLFSAPTRTDAVQQARDEAQRRREAVMRRQRAGVRA